MWASGVVILVLLEQGSVKAVVAALHRGSCSSALSKHLYRARGGWNKAFPNLPEIFLWTFSVFVLLRFGDKCGTELCLGDTILCPQAMAICKSTLEQNPKRAIR